MAPFDVAHLGALQSALLFGLIGFGFGAVLEATGFGNTRKLAAQFYLRDLTVLKTMFTAIVVAGVLVYGASALGVLDMNRVWINPTHLWPGIAGGLVMGVGFVIGGFCPGTSLVAAATGKIDGMVFVVGALVGVGAFGETLPLFDSFFLSGDLGRFTLSDWVGLPSGVVLLLVVSMALALFVGAEALEKRARNVDATLGESARNAARSLVLPSFRRGGAAALLLAAVFVAVRGQPNAAARLAMNPALQRLANERAMFVDPAEVVALRRDLNLHVDVLDLRPEAEFNLFHLAHAQRTSPEALTDRTLVRGLLEAEPTTVTFLIGASESQAFTAWRELRTRGVLNLYIIEGGVDRWLDLYPLPECVATRVATAAGASAWRFHYAGGASSPSAAPELAASRTFRIPCKDGASSPLAHEVTWPEHAYTSRVKLQRKALVKGGCG